MHSTHTHTPLNCAILLHVYRQLDYALPSTLTELFEIFILNTLKRDAKLQSAHSIAKRIRDLISLPPQFSSDLDHLCKLAFDGIVKDKMVFQFEEIEESKLLGLMTAFKSFSSVGDDLTYQFLHLTIQEFLAAKWVATQMTPEEQAKFFSSISSYWNTILSLTSPLKASLHKYSNSLLSGGGSGFR